MTVYVESNFVLEIALGQEQEAAAESMLALARDGGVTLAIPSCALIEPFSTVTRRGDRRRDLKNRLSAEILDLKRSRPHEEDVPNLEPMADLIGAIEDREKKRVDETVQRLIEVASIIELDPVLYGGAQALTREIGFTKMTDAIVCAAVLKHLGDGARPGPHFFATRDAKDFGSIGIVDRFRDLDCTIVFSFNECAQRLRINLST